MYVTQGGKAGVQCESGRHGRRFVKYSDAGSRDGRAVSNSRRESVCDFGVLDGKVSI